MKSTVRSHVGVRLRHARHDEDQRRPGRLFPQGELPPVLLLAEVPAVVAPEDDDRVVLVGALSKPFSSRPTIASQNATAAR